VWLGGVKLSFQACEDDDAGPHQETNKTRNATKPQGPIQRKWEATQLNAETRVPHSQDLRDHKVQPSRHDFYPDTLAQTPTKSGRTERGEKNYRSETGE